MNAIDGLFNFLSDTISKISSFIPKLDIPFDKFYKWWSYTVDLIKDANSLFPLDDLFIIMGLTIGFVIVFVTIWAIKFLKDFLSIF